MDWTILGARPRSTAERSAELAIAARLRQRSREFLRRSVADRRLGWSLARDEPRRGDDEAALFGADQDPVGHEVAHVLDRGVPDLEALVRRHVPDGLAFLAMPGDRDIARGADDDLAVIGIAGAGDEAGLLVGKAD